MSNSAPSTIEKFAATHLSRIAVESYGKPQPSPQTSATPSRAQALDFAGKRSLRVFGGALVVFACGMAAGYLLNGPPDLSPLRATNVRSGFGPAGLRIDYDLRNH